MKIIDDPFDYPEPFKPSRTPEKLEIKAEKRRAYRAKRLGRPIGKHGGYRKGAGRKRIKPYTHKAFITLDSIQLKLIEDLGQGDLNKGIQQLVEKYCG